MESQKQIRARLTNEISKQYKKKYEDTIQIYNDRIQKLCKSLDVLHEKYDALMERNNELGEKVRQYEDWNERLLEFMDLPKDERKQKFQEYQTERETEGMMGNLLCMFNKYFSLLY